MESRFSVLQAEIIEQKEIAEDTVQISFRLESKDFHFTPGQYVWVRIPQLSVPDPHGNQRGFSICTTPKTLPVFSIVFRRGRSGYKQSLLALPVGSKVEVSGPFGFFTLADDARPIVCIAGGTGITPFVSMIRFLVEEKSTKNVTLLYATHAAEMAAFKDELSDITKKYPNILVFHTVGKITDSFIRDHTGAIENPHWYISGPDALVTAVSQSLAHIGVPNGNFHFDEYCGFSAEDGNKVADLTSDDALLKYKIAIESATNHIIITNTNGVIVYANPAAQKITGFTNEEMIGQTPRLWGGLMGREFYEKLWHTIKIEKKPFSGQVLNHKKDYTIYTAYVRISPVVSNTGEVVGYIGTEEDISERSELRRELVMRERRFQKLIEKSKDVVILTDEKGVVSYVSPTITPVLGYTPEEYTGKDSLSLVHPDDLKVAQAKLGEIVQKPQLTANMQLRLRHNDGSWRWVEAIGTNLLSDESVHAIVTHIRDITDNKLATEALKNSELEYKQLFEHTLSGFALCEMIYNGDTPIDFRYLEVNTAFEKLTGLTNVVGKKATEIFPEIIKDEPDLIASFARVADTGTPERIELYFKALKIWLDLSIFSTKKGYFTAVFDNITARKIFDETVQNEKAQDEAMLNSIGEGLVVVNLDGDIILANRKLLSVFKKELKDMLGKKFYELWNLRDESGNIIAPEERPLSKAIKQGVLVTTTLSDGLSLVAGDVTIPVTITATPVRFKDAIIGAVEVFHDVSEEKEIDRAKTEFVSLASHQLRTPLSTIGWYSEMLLAGDAGSVTDEQKSYLEEIAGGNKRMVELVNGLLNVSRIEMGTFGIEPENIDVKQVVESVLKDVALQIKAREITVQTSYDNTGTIFADPKILTLIFQNLIVNAVLYTPIKGTVTIHVEKRADDVLFSVADTGIGIPEPAKKHVFTKLFRADNAKITQPDGNGLGLYMVKSILDHAGGTIWFESVEGKGTTFYVTIPSTGMKKKSGSRGLVL